MSHSYRSITLFITFIVFVFLSVLVENRSYNNGLIFYDLKSQIPYLPPTVSVSRGRVLSNVKFSTKGSIWSTFGKPCECSGAVCGCCAGITVKQYNFDQKMCANVTFVPSKAEAQLDVYLNEKPSAKYIVSARNPSPFCIPVMMGIPMAMCVQMSDISIKGNNLNMCMDFVVRLASTDLFEMHFQCMQMGLDGVQYLDKNGQPVIPPSNSKMSETDSYDYYDETATAEGSENEINENRNENENEIDKEEEIEREKVKDMEKYEELEKEIESHQQLEQLQQQLQQLQQQQVPEQQLEQQQYQQQQQIMEQQESEIPSTVETIINEDGIEANEAENEIIDAFTRTTTTTTTEATATKIDIGETNIDTDVAIHNSTIVDATSVAIINDKIAPIIATTTVTSTVANADNDSNNNNNESDNDNGDDDDKDNNDNNDEEDNYDTNPSDTNESEEDVTDENVVSTTIAAAAMVIETAEATAAAASIDSESTESSNEVSKLQTLTESDADANVVASATDADIVATTDAIIDSTDISEEESSLEATILPQADLKTRYRRLRG